MSVKIQQYMPSDRSTVKRFVEATQEYERVRVRDLSPGTEIGDAYTRKLLRAVAAKNGVILLATSDNEPIGFVCAWVDADRDMLLALKARSFAYISDIFVERPWRRKGIARKLLAAAEREMARRGCYRIRICSKAANRAAVAVYARSGFEPYETIFTKQIIP